MFVFQVVCLISNVCVSGVEHEACEAGLHFVPPRLPVGRRLPAAPEGQPRVQEGGQVHVNSESHFVNGSNTN
jgi:hypothetical protein